MRCSTGLAAKMVPVWGWTMTEPLCLTLEGAEVLRPEGLSRDPIGLDGGLIAPDLPGRRVDLAGCRVLPGIVDAHGDGFERHVAPRRGAMKDIATGLRAAEAEIAANGITTGVLAQFISWEGGLRGREFAETVFGGMAALDSLTDLIPQLRFETHLLDMYAELPDWLARFGISYVVFNDHLPHDRLAAGRTPKRLVGQALKAGRSPETHLALMQELHARSSEVPDALDDLCAVLSAAGLRMGSHDDRTVEERAIWQARGVDIAEFPETLEAAEAPGVVVMGAPNVVRGGSHNGNLSALDLVMMGVCDALASDYHYPSSRRAALMLEGAIGLPAAWALLSSGPAALLGLSDRGALAPGLRADLVVLDPTGRIGATIAAGRVSYMTGEVAARFLAA